MRHWMMLFLLLLATIPVLETAQAAGRCDYSLRLSGPDELLLAIQAVCADVAKPGFSKPVGATAGAISEQWQSPDGLTMRYQLSLGRLAELGQRPEIARRYGQAVVASLPAWLIEPEEDDAAVTLATTLEDGLDLALAAPRDAQGRYYFRVADIPFGGFSVMGRFPRATLPVTGGSMDVVAFAETLRVSEAVLLEWLGDSAREVARYFGRFPVARGLVLVLPVAGRDGVVFGQVRGGGGGTVMLQVGERAERAALYDDWKLVHELVHLGGPFVVPRGAWLMEGMATYAEPLIRARAGWRSPDQLWREFATDMQRGLPALTLEGLSRVSRSGVYWGGALYMLLADIDIRERSQGRVSLDTCFRAILQAGGDTTQRWSRARVIQVCDAATGTGSMARLESLYVTQPGPLDIAALWRDLGVSVVDGILRFDDMAPKAYLRQAITRGD